MNKEEMKQAIQEKVSESQTFGNSIVDIADAWRDAIGDKLDRMSKKELELLYFKAMAAKE